MSIDEVLSLLLKISTQTSKKSEIKVYEDFIQVLSNLNKIDLSKEEIQSIEKELDNLNLKQNQENKKKHFKKALNSFKEYLKKEFSIISKGYYTAIGMSLGMCFGVAFGSVIKESLGTSSGLVFGMLIGLVIGRTMDAKAEKEGRVLQTMFPNNYSNSQIK